MQLAPARPISPHALLDDAVKTQDKISSAVLPKADYRPDTCTQNQGHG